MPKTRMEAKRQATQLACVGLVFATTYNIGIGFIFHLAIEARPRPFWPVIIAMVLTVALDGIPISMLVGAFKMNALARTLPETAPEEPEQQPEPQSPGQAQAILRAIRCPSCTGTIPAGVELCPYCESPRELTPA